MNDREAKILAIRAVDGELDETDRARLEAYCDNHPEMRAFLEEEREASRAAAKLCDGLRLTATDLPEAVLKRLVRPRLGRLVPIAAGVAAAVLVGILLLAVADRSRGKRRTLASRSASFQVLVGETPQSMADGAFLVLPGDYAIEASRSTLVVTEAGNVHLSPGRFQLTVEDRRVTVRAVTGEARLENSDGTLHVEEGSANQMARPVLALALASPVGVEGDAEREFEISGVVRDRAGQPLGGARIWVSTGVDPAAGQVLGTTGSDGAYEIEGLRGPRRYVGAEAKGWAPSDLRIVESKEASALTVDFRLLDKGGAIGGVVRATSGAPVSGAVVFVGGYYRNLPVQQHSPEGYRLTHARPRRIVTDEEGRYAADGLPPEWNMIRVQAAGFAHFRTYVRLPPGGAAVRDVTLAAGTSVTGIVRDEFGAAVPDARVLFVLPYSANVAARAQTDESGRYVLGDLPEGTLELAVDGGDRGQAHARIQTRKGESVEWHPVLTSGTIVEGVVIHEDGAPVGGARVWCRDAFRPSADYHVEMRTDDRGAFRFERRRRVSHQLSIWRPELPGMRAGAPDLLVRVEPDEGPQTLHLPRAPEGWGPRTIEGTILLPNREPAQRARVKTWPVGEPGWHRTTVSSADGAFRIDGLKPGCYRLEVHLDGHPTLHLNEVDVEQEGAGNLGSLRFPQPGRIRCCVVDENGLPMARMIVSVRSVDSRIYHAGEKEADGTHFLSEGLAPGRYLVGAGAVGNTHEVEVREGETTDVEIPWRAPTRVSLQCVTASGTAASTIWLTVTDAKGRIALGRHQVELEEGGRTIWLVPGRYRIDCEELRGETGSTEIEVPRSDDAVPVRVDLR